MLLIEYRRFAKVSRVKWVHSTRNIWDLLEFVQKSNDAKIL